MGVEGEKIGHPYEGLDDASLADAIRLEVYRYRKEHGEFTPYHKQMLEEARRRIKPLMDVLVSEY